MTRERTDRAASERARSMNRIQTELNVGMCATLESLIKTMGCASRFIVRTLNSTE